MTPEQEIMKGLMENQSAMIDSIKQLTAENIEIKAQLAGKTPQKKDETEQPTEAELDTVFRNLKI